jgi:DNA-binding transcriptional LysR family regulator
VQVLSDWGMGEIELHAVFPADKAAKPAARAFLDCLIEQFAGDHGFPLGRLPRVRGVR